MDRVRLNSEQRRRRIVDAAVPLFARKGFAGTSTKEIAAASGISQALLFKHFPTKAALYADILQRGCLGDPRLERLLSLEPSTFALIDMVHFMLRYTVLAAGSDPELETKQRMMLNSFLEDGEYAHLALEWLSSNILPWVEACLKAAAANGDLEDLPASFAHRFWLTHHLAVMLGFVRLAKRDIVPRIEPTETLIRDAAQFILRGLGVKDAIVRSYRGSGFSHAGQAAE